MTTQGQIAGIGLGRLLREEHASTPQSGVEAPRLLKRSLPRLYYCCCCFRKRFTEVGVYVHKIPAINFHATPWQKVWASRLPTSPPPPRRSTPDNWRSEKNAKNRRKPPFIAAPTPTCQLHSLYCAYPTSLQTGIPTNSNDN